MNSFPAAVWQKSAGFIRSRRLPIFLIGVGVLLRLKYYSENLSLWLDEAALALEILRRSFQDILLAVNYNHFSPTAPVGFLLLEKSVIAGLGSGEGAFRLVPLLSSIVSVFLFLPLARKYVRPEAASFALALFVFAGPVIYYSAQMKSYSCDVLAAILVLWGAGYLRSAGLAAGRIIVAGVTAAAVLWFSYGVLFVVAGALATLIAVGLLRRQWKKCVLWGWVACLASISFMGIYFNDIRQISHNGGLSRMWEKAFMPWPVGSWASIIWSKDAALNAFNDTMGLPLTYLAAILFCLGAASVFRQDREKCFLLVSPFAMVLLAAAAHKYPFSGRFILFLVPSFALLTAEGMAYLVNKSLHRPAVALLLGAAVFFHPIKNAADILSRAHAFEEMRPVVRHLKEHYQAQDAVFLNNSAQYAYGYYSGYYGLNVQAPFAGVLFEPLSAIRDFNLDNHAVYVNYARSAQGHLVGWNVSTQSGAFLKAEWEKIRYNNRTWLIFSHAPTDYQRTVLDYFNREGRKLEEFHSPGASIYLFDMGKF